MRSPCRTQIDSQDRQYANAVMRVFEIYESPSTNVRNRVKRRRRFSTRKRIIVAVD